MKVMVEWREWRSIVSGASQTIVSVIYCSSVIVNIFGHISLLMGHVSKI